MDTQTIILVLSIFFISSFLKGLTGLGFSTICLGILATFMDLKLAIPLVLLPSLYSNIVVMVQAGHFFEALKRFWLLYLSALPSLILGILFLANSQNEAPKVILGVVMFIYGVWALKNGIKQLSKRKEKQLLIPIGFVSGLVNGATGSQIMPIMPYLLSLNINREMFIQTINIAFTFNTLIMMLGLGKLGVLTLPSVYVSLGGILPVILGIFLGALIRKKTSEGVYRKLVLFLLIGLGTNLVIQSFL